MRKLVLRCGFAPGDIVMLTAAVRDLHRCYPGRFLTDVRTCYPAIWEHNPYLVSLDEAAADVRTIHCSYPLINRCNRAPYHCLHGFIEFLNECLGLSIKPTAFKGDLYLSEREKTWYSQVYELTHLNLPFWIIDAGGKYDITIKWWHTSRYQAVVNHYRGRIQFVQVGEMGHHHPQLDGVIDLRGKTNLRELIRLVYHAQGVLCPVTALMHLAAAVPIKPGQPVNRPCVVIAGGREPVHWEAYPGHQFIHTNGALDCCPTGGCWKDRTVRLRDGDERDRPNNRCLRVSNGLPRCMDMISPADVIRRIDLYFEGQVIRQLAKRELPAAARAIRATATNQYDQQPLNIHNAGLACDEFVQSLPAPPAYQGSGIVICAGGPRYLVNAWVCIRMLRHLRCSLPVQIWHLGPQERDVRMEGLLAPWDVTFVDAMDLTRQFPVRRLGGWELKAYALLHSPFQKVLLLDADNVPVLNPEYLFESAPFRKTGAVFWPDLPHVDRKAFAVWRSCGLARPKEPEFESGQILVDKRRTWHALRLALWFNENSDFYYRYVYGDKETFHLAFRKLRQPYSLVPIPVRRLAATLCQHDFDGRRVFQHRNCDKWDLFLMNPRVPGFWYETECRGFIRELQNKWDGGLAAHLNGKARKSCCLKRKAPRIQPVMISCPEREPVRRRTIDNLRQTDWTDAPVLLQVDPGTSSDRRARQTECALLGLRQGLASEADYILFLEDDLIFNRHLRHNLLRWNPLRSGAVGLAGLYNPRLREMAFDFRNNARIIAPGSIFGSQAFLISRVIARRVVRQWDRIPGMQDVRISRIAGTLKTPVFYHAPSLVQHVGTESVWGGPFHQATDFDPDWRA